jgi:cytochrome c55X
MRSIVEWTLGIAVTLTIFSGISLSALAALPSDPNPVAFPEARASALRHLLTQDCGSCHGLSLAGGLGPSLQPQSVANKPVEFLAYTILNGRPGTAMPPWSPFLTESEGLWLAREIKGLNP